MNLVQLTYFVDTVDEKSFTAAARKNFVSQTAISQQIAKLEETMGSQLIDRGKTPLQMTRAGRVLYEQAKIILQQYHYLLSKMQQVKQQQSTLSVAFMKEIGSHVLLNLFVPFYQQHPDISLSLQAKSYTEIDKALQDRHCDVAIAHQQVFNNRMGLDLLKIEHETFSVIVNKNHSFANKPALVGSDLAEQPLIIQGPEHLGAAYYHLLEHCRQDGYTPRIAKIVDSIETAALLVELNQGIAFVPKNFQLSTDFTQTKILTLTQTHHYYDVVLARRRGDNSPTLMTLWNSVSNIKI